VALSDKHSEPAVGKPETRLRSASGSHRPLSGLFGGIGRRLLIGVLAVSSLVTLALTALQLYLEYRRDVDAINDRLDEIGRSYLGSIGQSLWNLDEDQLELQLNGILRLPDVGAAELRETTQASSPITIAVGESGTNAGIVRDYPVVHMVDGAERSIGILRVEATLAGVYRSLLDRALILLASQGAKTVLVISPPHVASEAYPSPTDVRLSQWQGADPPVELYPGAYYVLVSLKDRENPVVRVFRRFFPVSHDNSSGHFFTVENGRRMATPLFIVLLVIESTDVAFALDSIPAILAITKDPFIVFTSNVFALLGLRSLYFVLAGLMEKFRYL